MSNFRVRIPAAFRAWVEGKARELEGPGLLLVKHRLVVLRILSRGLQEGACSIRLAGLDNTGRMRLRDMRASISVTTIIRKETRSLSNEEYGEQA